MATLAEILAQARQLHQAGDLGRAEQLYRQVRQADPANGEVAYLLGMTCHQGGRLEEAATHYREALRLKPDYATAHFNLGLALVAQGKTVEANPHFSEAARLKPELAAQIDRALNSYRASPSTHRSPGLGSKHD